MNYLTDIKDRRDAGKTASEIAAEINAEQRALASNYRAVKSQEVADWLASNGMESRVDKVLATLTENPAYDTFASAWAGVKAIRGNINATMNVTPGRPHRELILAAISAGIMQQIDLTTIDSIAYTGTDATTEQVTAVIADWDGIVNQWDRLYVLGDAYARTHSDATLQQVYDAVVGGV